MFVLYAHILREWITISDSPNVEDWDDILYPNESVWAIPGTLDPTQD
jgi:hypothetical protein